MHARCRRFGPPVFQLAEEEFCGMIAAMRTMSCLVGLVLLGAAVSAQTTSTPQGGKPTMFVAPLEGDISAIMAWQPAMGEGLAEMLITELNRVGKYDILESTSLKDLAKEIELGQQGWVNEQEKVDKGGWAGADYMFKGKVTRFGANKKGVNLGGFVPFSGGDLGVKMTTADVRVDWRIVDVYNRKVIKTGSATASHKGTAFDVGAAVQGHGGRIGYQNQDFMNSALGKATAKAVTNIVEEVIAFNPPESGRVRSKAAVQSQQQAADQAAADALRSTPGKVLAVVNKNTVIVSLGSRHGFRAGDKLKIYEVLDTKDDKGAVVFSEEKLYGELTLDSVQEERSKATYGGSGEVKTGWVVKLK
jgi:curli biogenesis system outer membrane secretion channel CsgG